MIKILFHIVLLYIRNDQLLATVVVLYAFYTHIIMIRCYNRPSYFFAFHVLLWKNYTEREKENKCRRKIKRKQNNDRTIRKTGKNVQYDGSVSGVAYVKCNYYAYALVTATYVCCFFFSFKVFGPWVYCLDRESVGCCHCFLFNIHMRAIANGCHWIGTLE